MSHGGGGGSKKSGKSVTYYLNGPLSALENDLWGKRWHKDLRSCVDIGENHFVIYWLGLLLGLPKG
jgi:hypothetical protein